MLLVRGLLLLALSGQLIAADDEWLGADILENNVGVKFGRDNVSGQLKSFDANLKMPLDAVLNIGYSSAESDDNVEVDSHYISLSSDPYLTWSVQLSYQDSANDKVLEAEDIAFSVFYFSGDWLVELGYSEGSVESFYDRRLFQLGLVDTNSVTTDRHSYSLGLDYFHGNWSYSLALQDLHYDDNLQTLPARPLVRFLLGDQTLSELLALNDWRADLSAGYRWGETKATLGLVRYKTIVDNAVDDTYYVSVDQNLTQQISAAFLLAKADSLTYSELSLYYSW